ncbi:uncharacterized protein METZ01_LOCUS98061 [marine metagenome]|uniref:BZIP domain-containing protein n=1 Tax=marine metagenome TaxID=408172 RepID=A0A381VZZ1_9ZZZZ
MEVVQTEDTSFVRDLHSKALINTDRVALENHRKKRQIEIQQAKKWQQMEIKVEELNNMRNEILEIKGLLQEVLNKKEL